MSKTLALTQELMARASVSPTDGGCQTVMIERLELIADTFLSVGTPVQHALPALLECRAQAHDAITARTRQNLGHLRETLTRAASPATLLRTEGGWYATLRLPRTQSETSWVLDLLEKDGVHVHPGAFFDFADEAFVVLSLLTPEPIFAEGVARLITRAAQS